MTFKDLKTVVTTAPVLVSPLKGAKGNLAVTSK